MPTYTYACSNCGHRFNLFHSISDDTEKRCPICDQVAQRQMGGGTAWSGSSKSNATGLSSAPAPSIPRGGFT